MVNHIRVKRKLYYHHGIYIGNGEVIHYNGELFQGKRNAKVVKTSLQEFLKGGKVEVVRHKKHFLGTTILNRAERYLGRSSYSLIFNNCEHFATYCATGVGISKQVNKIMLPVFKLGAFLF